MEIVMDDVLEDYSDLLNQLHIILHRVPVIVMTPCSHGRIRDIVMSDQRRHDHAYEIFQLK